MVHIEHELDASLRSSRVFGQTGPAADEADLGFSASALEVRKRLYGRRRRRRRYIGTTNFGYLAGSAINLGPNALTNDYEFRIGYTGSTHTLALDLLNSVGQRIGGQTVDLDTDVPGLQLNGSTAQEINAFALTHLGWSDYTGNGGNRATVWKVNSLAFDNTLTGAYQASVHTPETWTTGYDGVGEPSSSGWIEGGGSTWFHQPGGIMEYTGFPVPETPAWIAFRPGPTRPALRSKHASK